MKGLPLAYHTDMQEDKEPVFDVSDTLEACLQVVARMIPSIRIDRKRVAEALREGFMEATDVADYLVARGVPFRDAHRLAGRLVLFCARDSRRLSDLTLEEFRQFSPQFESDISVWLRPHSMVKRRDHFGGTAPRQVWAALRRAKRQLQV